MFADGVLVPACDPGSFLVGYTDSPSVHMRSISAGLRGPIHEVSRVLVFLGEKIWGVVSASDVDNIDLAGLLRFSDSHVANIDVMETAIVGEWFRPVDGTLVVIEYWSGDGRIGEGKIFENVTKSLDEFATCIGCTDFGLACTAGDFTFAFDLPGDSAAHSSNDGAVEGSTFINNGDGVVRRRSIY
jgi:hypothetical protein